MIPFRLWELELAGRYLRAKRREGGVALISLIAFFGILASVAMLIIVMSVMNGFRTELLSRMLGFNGHAYVGGATALNTPGRDVILPRLRAVEGVTEAVPIVEAYSLAEGTTTPQPAVIRGMRPEDVRRSPIITENLVAGSLNDFGQGEYGGDVILMGEVLAANLGVGVGDAVTLYSPSGESTAFGSAPRSKAYVIGGVFAIGLSEYDQAFVYMPLEQAQLFFGRGEAVDTLELRVTDPDRIAEQLPALRQAAGPGALVITWQERNRTFFEALQVERVVMRLILMLIVLIAALNIISGLVMLVKNKGRDIAVLRTMGARRSSILRIFVLAGGSIGFAGTLAGLLVGTLFCLNIGPIQGFVEGVTGATVFSSEQYYLDRLPARVEWGEVAMITAWSLVVSILCTLPPALRAARLDPVEALRYE